MRKSTSRFWAVAVVASLSLASSASAELIYAVATEGAAQALYTFDSATPGNIVGAPLISGLQPNEAVLGIDFRPATGDLYALGSSSRLYTLNTATGAATAVSATAFGPPALSGISYGFDFNPSIDRIRVVSETNQNLVLHPGTGAIDSVGTNLFYPIGGDPNVVNSTYNAASQLYGIDTGLDALVTQANNAGTLTLVGGLGVSASAAGGFDFSAISGVTYAALRPIGQDSNLYTIDLGTGLASLVGQIGPGVTITALSVNPVPEPASLALAGFGLLAAAAVRRRSR